MPAPSSWRRLESNLMQGGIAQHVLEHAMQDARPLLLPTFIGDQVLADLEQRMREAQRFGMSLDGIAMAIAARVGLIVADHEVRLVGETPHQRHWHARVLVPQHADMPGPLEA